MSNLFVYAEGPLELIFDIPCTYCAVRNVNQYTLIELSPICPTQGSMDVLVFERLREEAEYILNISDLPPEVKEVLSRINNKSYIEFSSNIEFTYKATIDENAVLYGCDDIYRGPYFIKVNPLVAFNLNDYNFANGDHFLYVSDDNRIRYASFLKHVEFSENLREVSFEFLESNRPLILNRVRDLIRSKSYIHFLPAVIKPLEPSYKILQDSKNDTDVTNLFG